MNVLQMQRDLSKEAFLWTFLVSPAFTDRSYDGLKVLDRFIRDLQETNPVGQEFEPAVYWVGVIRELLATYPNARAMLEHENFEEMERWSIRLGDIGRGFRESALWMGIEDFKEILKLFSEAYGPACTFESAARMSIFFNKSKFLDGEKSWDAVKHDRGFRGASVLTYFEGIGDIEEYPEYASDPDVSCRTGEIVPTTGVWVPVGGMGTAALALARQGQMMQPMYPIVDVDENKYEYVQPTETEWYLVKPTGRMISLRTPENRERRVPAGEPCPQAGWWYTPARADSRRYFKQGEMLPKIGGSDYGETLWQWARDQSKS